MVVDPRRNDAYADALRANITANSTVLDIGAGTGFFTLLACKAGARKVFAVESDPIIQVARELIAANGFNDRVELTQAPSTAVALPHRVDVIVSDLHGCLPFFAGGPSALIDARDRFLNDGGVLIPKRDTVWLAITRTPQLHRRIVGPWEQENLEIDFMAARRRAVNTWLRCSVPADSIIVEPRVWSLLDYATLRTASAFERIEWKIENPGDAHGLCAWFDCETAPGIGFSNAPGASAPSLYEQGFFPWPRPCVLKADDVVHVELRADLVGDDYVWTWNTEVRAPTGRTKEKFQQSGFFGAAISADWMRKTADSFVPSPNVEARVDKLILDGLLAECSLADIARQVTEGFPERFPDLRRALTRVGELSLRYSK